MTMSQEKFKKLWYAYRDEVGEEEPPSGAGAGACTGAGAGDGPAPKRQKKASNSRGKPFPPEAHKVLSLHFNDPKNQFGVSDCNEDKHPIAFPSTETKKELCSAMDKAVLQVMQAKEDAKGSEKKLELEDLPFRFTINQVSTQLRTLRQSARMKLLLKKHAALEATATTEAAAEATATGDGAEDGTDDVAGDGGAAAATQSS